MDLAAGQCRHAVRLHRIGVCVDHRMFIVDRHAGRHAAKIRVAVVLHRLLPQSVHDLSLDRHDAGVHWHRDFHRTDTAQAIGGRTKASHRCQENAIVGNSI